MNQNTAKYLIQNFINLKIKKHETFTIPVYDEIVVQTCKLKQRSKRS